MEINGLDCYLAIEEKIKKLIEKNADRKKELTEELQNKQTKQLEKVGIKLDLLLITNELKKQQELLKALSSLHHYIHGDKYTFPTELVEQFEDLGTFLNKEELEQLRSAVNHDLHKANSEEKKDLKEKSEDIRNTLNKLGLSDKPFLIYDFGHEVKGKTTYQDAVQIIERDILEALSVDSVFIHQKNKTDQLWSSDTPLIFKIEDMISNNQLEHSKNVDSIISNFSKIRQMFILSEKCQNILTLSPIIRIELSKISEFDTSGIIDFLLNLENKYKKERKKANEYLKKFDFGDIKEQIESKEAKDAKEKLTSDKILSLQRLVCQLEKLKSGGPNNQDEISEIKEQIQYLKAAGLTKEQIKLAETNGKADYDREVRGNKALPAKEEYEEQLQEAMSDLRKAAEGLVEEDESYLIKNGGDSFSAEDKESRVQLKIKYLIECANISPEERGLREWKKMGILKQNATLDSLTSSQLNSLRIGYSDAALGLTNYKKLKQREKDSPFANTIYRAYIKYRADCQALGEPPLTFSNYAESQFGVYGANDYIYMVDSDLLKMGNQMENPDKGFGK